MQEGRKSKLVVVSGPSGVGKSTICREVVKRMDNVRLSVSLTTRPKANGEVNGEDYRFVSKEEFLGRMNEGLLLEYAEVFGNLYGTPRDKVEESLAAGVTVILEIDVQGGRQVKEAYPADTELVFILPPSQKHLEERMNHRARDDDEVARRRLAEASNEIAAAWRYYDHMVINDNLEQAIKEVMHIIET